MKKYMTLLLSILSLAGLLWASAISIRMLSMPSPAMPLAQAASMPRDRDAALQRLRGLDQVLLQIDRLALLAPQTGAFAGPLAQAPESLQHPALQPGLQKSAARPGAASPLPVFSMIYLSSDMERVVVNGNLYEVGDLLPGGARLVDIGMHQVVIDVGHRRQVVQLPKNQILGSTRTLQ